MARSRFLMTSILIAFLSGPVVASAEVPRVESAPATSASASINPEDDPWLSEEGPAVAAPVEEPREAVRVSWDAAPAQAQARAAAVHRVLLESGLAPQPAVATLIGAAATEDAPEIYSGLARDLAPGVPTFEMEHAWTLAGLGDVGGAILALGRALWSMAGNLEGQIWLLENVTILLLFVLLAASIGFIVLSAIHVAPHAAHDIGDLLSPKAPIFARYGALAALMLAPLAFGEGLLGLLLALFVLAFAYGRGHARNVLAMAGVVLVIGLHPLAQVAQVVTQLIETDPVASSALSVAAGLESAADVERLEDEQEADLVAAHVLAYRDRRLGLVEGSLGRLEAILAQQPSDGVALANRGNIEKRRGRSEEAIRYYERAAAQLDSPTLLFNLSQAYAEAFRMDEYEATLSRAQALGDSEVAALSALEDAELVADLAFPMTLVRDRLWTHALKDQPGTRAIGWVAPGRLGESWLMTAGAFAVASLLCLLLANRWDHSSICTRCGHRICTRCQETVWSEEICDDCHHLFEYPESTDPSLRMARLQELSEWDVRKGRIATALSILIPGVAGLVARRPDFAMFGCLLFSWTVAWLVWPSGIFADPMLMGKMGLLLFGIPGTLALIGYWIVVGASLAIRKRR